MMSPNLFDYATSELSQDAFLAWLLCWADDGHGEADPPLHEVALAFVHALFRAGGIEPPAGAFAVEVETQRGRIDVVARVGDRHAIVIEDKTRTSEHTNQLARYRERFAKEHPGREVAYVYLKTGDQGSFAEVERSGWGVFRRCDLLRVLSAGRGSVTNAIYVDYLDYLERLDAAANSFSVARVEDWDRLAWGGFFTKLKDEFPDGRWRYVSNPRRGFMGFWWSWVEVEGGWLYLQLEEARLVVRLAVNGDGQPGPTDRRALWNDWSDRVLKLSSPRFRRPARYRSGSTMSVAVLDGGYLVVTEDGRVDFERTVKALKETARAVAAVTDRVPQHAT